MKEQNLSPEQQIQRIEDMVFKARLNLEENGFAFILWGITIAVTSFLQAYLMYNGKSSISGYPYLAMPLVGLFTFFYYAKKDRGNKNPIDKVYAVVWIVTGINIMAVAFGFGGSLGGNLIAFILILIGIATIVSGSFLSSKLLLASGLILNLGGFAAFFLDNKEQPVLMGLLTIFSVLIPGIVLSAKHKKKHV